MFGEKRSFQASIAAGLDPRSTGRPPTKAKFTTKPLLGISFAPVRDVNLGGCPCASSGKGALLQRRRSQPSRRARSRRWVLLVFSVPTPCETSVGGCSHALEESRGPHFVPGLAGYKGEAIPWLQWESLAPHPPRRRTPWPKSEIVDLRQRLAETEPRRERGSGPWGPKHRSSPLAREPPCG